MLDNSFEENNSPRLSQAHLLLYATIAASVALSIVSAYETYLGLLDFLGRTVVGNIASTILTFGIQVLLFAISWSIASHIRDGFRQNAARWAIWVLCAFFSGYFSYYGFVETTGGRNEATRAAVISKEVQVALQEVDNRFDETLTQRHQTELLDSQVYKEEWVEGSLRSMIELANGAEQAIADAAIVERDKLLKEKVILQNQLEDLNKKLQDAKFATLLFQNEIEKSDADFVRLTKQINTLDARLLTARGEVTNLKAQLEKELGTGDGPKARKLREDVNSKEAEVSGITNELSEVQRELDRVDSVKIKIKLRQEDDQDAQKVVKIDSDIEAITADIADIDRRIEETKVAVSFKFDEEQGLLDNSLAGLVKKDYTQFDALLNQCNQISQQLTNARLKDKVGEIACSNTEVTAIVADLRSVQEQQVLFRTDCLQNSEALLPIKSDDKVLFQPVIGHVTKCMSFEKDASARDDLVSRLTRLQTQRGDNVDPITMGAVALFNDRQGNAIMSAIFAIIVDILVLLCALVGRTVGLPERVRSIDELLKLGRSYTGDQTGVEKVVDLSGLEPAKRSMVDAVVNDLLRADLVEYADNSGDILHLKRGGSARLAALRRQEIEEASDVIDAQYRSSNVQAGGGGRRKRR